MKEARNWIGIGTGVILLLTLLYIVAAWMFPSFRVISRDIAIVVLAGFMLVATLLSIVLLVAVLYIVYELYQLTQKEVLPKINATTARIDEALTTTQAAARSLRHSADNATTTTVFVAEHVASPIIRVSSMVAGVRAAARTLARRDGRKKPLPGGSAEPVKQKKRPMELGGQKPVPAEPRELRSSEAARNRGLPVSDF
ncbi:MAG: hypothetical protein HC884_04155 [Chloroflexaceae bacterium]|nr:hypothetical protein [Chloroflexaceae bacterium]